MGEEEVRERSVSGSSDADNMHQHEHQHTPQDYAQGTQHTHTHTQGKQYQQHHLTTKTKANTHPSTTVSAPHSVQSEEGMCRRDNAGVIVPVGEGGREMMIGEERRVVEEEMGEREEEKRVRKGPVGGDCNTENSPLCDSFDTLATERSVASSRAVLGVSSSPDRQQQIESNRKESLKMGDIHIILCVDEDENTEMGSIHNPPSQDEIEHPEHRQANAINTSKSNNTEGLRTADGGYENEPNGAVADAKVEMHDDGKRVTNVQYKEIKGMAEMHEDSEGENVASVQYNSVKNMAKMYDEKISEVAAGIEDSGETDKKKLSETGNEVRNEVSGMCNTEVNGNELAELCNEENGNEVNEISESSSENKYNDNDVRELLNEASIVTHDETTLQGRISPPPAQCIPSRGLSAIPEEIEVCIVQE